MKDVLIMVAFITLIAVSLTMVAYGVYEVIKYKLK